MGLIVGSRRVHASTNDLASAETPTSSGNDGDSRVLAILKIACTAPPQSLHGGAPVSISITVHPMLQTSAGAPCACCRTTSGAIQNALPAMPSFPPPDPDPGAAREGSPSAASDPSDPPAAPPATPPPPLDVVPARSTIVFAIPKSASLILPLFSTSTFAPLTSLWTVLCAWR